MRLHFPGFLPVIQAEFRTEGQVINYGGAGAECGRGAMGGPWHRVCVCKLGSCVYACAHALLWVLVAFCVFECVCLLTEISNWRSQVR